MNLKKIFYLFSLLWIQNFLLGCFLIPKVSIKGAFFLENCQKLSGSLIYDLSLGEIKKSIEICMKKEKYKKALKLLNHLELRTSKVEDKKNILERRSGLHFHFLKNYFLAEEDLKKALKYQPQSEDLLTKLLLVQIKSGQFNAALKNSLKLMSLEGLSPKKKLETKFIKARLLFLTEKRMQAIKIFEEIKKEDLDFFEMNQGSFYLALLFEEEKSFLKAIQELRSVKWAFADEKTKHWEYRIRNSPDFQ